MTQVAWATEVLRVYAFVALTILSVRAVLWVSGETRPLSWFDRLVNVTIRLAVVWVVATVLGYL